MLAALGGFFQLSLHELNNFVDVVQLLLVFGLDLFAEVALLIELEVEICPLLF